MTHPLTPREKLKPCPFCGGEAMFEAEHPMYEGRMFVGCKDCCAEAEPLASDQYTKAEQAEAWNRRTALASGSGDHAELARLAEAVGLLREAVEPYEHISDVRAFEVMGNGPATRLVAIRTFLSKEAERG